MATVRFSDSLRETIANNAKAKFNASVEKAEAHRPHAIIWGDKLWNALFQNYNTVLCSVPAGFIHHVKGFRIRMFYVQHEMDNVPCNLDFEFSKEMPWPKDGHKAFGLNKFTNWQEHYDFSPTLCSDPVVKELIQLVIARNQAVDEAKNRREEFVKSVKEVINAHVTLAPALKMWPPLWDLLPIEVKDKHREVKDRVAKVPEVSVDLNRLTALSALSKIGGA